MGQHWWFTMWESLHEPNKPRVHRLAAIGYPFFGALAIFGFGLAVPGMIGTTQHMGTIGVVMLGLAVFFLAWIIGDLKNRIEDLERKAGIRK